MLVRVFILKVTKILILDLSIELMNILEAFFKLLETIL